MKLLLYALPGALFGAGLAISGMTNPAKVINFLDVAGHWDPSLAFVMAGAIAVFATLNQLIHTRPAPLLGGSLPGRRATSKVSPRLLIGASLFGVGWGLGGVCPGPALTDLGLLRPDVLAFVGAMLVGMLIAQRGFGVDVPKGEQPSDEAAGATPEPGGA